jgi:hypothetical protein
MRVIFAAAQQRVCFWTHLASSERRIKCGVLLIGF